jgi:uncharacterized membrane protein YhaH (DUF805 family)
MEWYLKVLKQYADFGGRARRKEYWMFVLFNVIIIVLLAAIDAALGTDGILMILYSLAVLIPSIAVAVRRLHDTGRSGWWVLIDFVPLLIGSIWLLVLMVLDSQPGENQYGPNPKEISMSEIN